MSRFSRRDFLKLGGILAAAAATADPRAMAAGLERLAGGLTRVVWMEGQSCSGCSVSLLNTRNPGPVALLTDYISLVFHPTIGAAQGQTAHEVWAQAEEAGDYILVLEGSIPLAEPEACRVGGRALTEILPGLVRNARFLVAAGTCAAFGGVPAAEGNPTGAVGARDYLDHLGLESRGFLTCCPSCPVHPSSLVGTLATLAGGTYPDVDAELLTPAMYYSRSTHDNCPRFHDYSRHIYASHFGDPRGCLFELGCLGPQTHTECPQRQWNGGVNWCIRAGAPCIGCSSPDFVRHRDFPLYRLGEEEQAEVLPDHESVTGGVS